MRDLPGPGRRCEFSEFHPPTLRQVCNFTRCREPLPAVARHPGLGSPALCRVSTSPGASWGSGDRGSDSRQTDSVLKISGSNMLWASGAPRRRTAGFSQVQWLVCWARPTAAIGLLTTQLAVLAPRLRHHLGHDLLRPLPRRLGVEVEHQPVPQHRQRHARARPPGRPSPRPSIAARALAPSTRYCDGPRPRAPVHELPHQPPAPRGRPGRVMPRQAHRVAPPRVRRPAPGAPARCSARICSARQHRLQLAAAGRPVVRSTIGTPPRPARVAHVQLEHEAVELRLGQRVGALLLDGVLRGQDEERRGPAGRSRPPP